MSGTERLLKLLALADQGPVMRAALAEELAELLIDWPATCPREMRGPCEALLSRAVKEVDAETCARLRLRLHSDPNLSARVLPHDATDNRLAAMVRAGEPIVPCMAQALGISESLAVDILQDASGHALAVATKALGLSRANFSALALLAQPGGDLGAHYARLDTFDAVSEVEASQEWQRWTHPHAA